jgi:hypothetical protein
MDKFYVWIEYSGPRFANREVIEKTVGRECHGGGGPLDGGPCDCSWHGLSEEDAKSIAALAKTLPFVEMIDVYEARTLNRQVESRKP